MRIFLIICVFKKISSKIRIICIEVTKLWSGLTFVFCLHSTCAVLLWLFSVAAGMSFAEINSLLEFFVWRFCWFWDVITTEELSDCKATFLAAGELDVDDDGVAAIAFFLRCGTRPGNSSRRSRASR